MTASELPWKRRADVVLGAAAAGILLAMMALTVVDVVARYVFSRPVRGAFEVTELMLLVLIFAGLPLVSFSDEHAVMDFIDRILGSRGQRWLERLVQVACAAGVALGHAAAHRHQILAGIFLHHRIRRVRTGIVLVVHMKNRSGDGAVGKAGKRSRMSPGIGPVHRPGMNAAADLAAQILCQPP